MLKILGSIMVIAALSGIGFCFADGLKKKLELMEAIKATAYLMHGNIKYANATLPEALLSVAGKHKGILKEFLCDIIGTVEENDGESFMVIWNGAIDKIFPDNPEESGLLRRLGEIFMYTDRRMQLSGIELFMEQIDAEITELSHELKPNCYLYKTMGILAGIFVVIVAL